MEINFIINEELNFLAILYQIIKKQNSFSNLSISGIDGLRDSHKEVVKEFFVNYNEFDKKIEKDFELKKIYLKNKKTWKAYWGENKPFFWDIKYSLIGKCKNFDFSIFKKVGNFFDFKGPKKINVFICMGNEIEIGTGNAFSPNTILIFPRNFKHYSEKSLQLDFGVLLHEIVHLFQGMCNEPNRNLRERVAQCFAPKGILINETQFKGNRLIFDKIKFEFEKDGKYTDIRKDLLSFLSNK